MKTTLHQVLRIFVFISCFALSGGFIFSPRKQVYAKYYAEIGSDALISVPFSGYPVPTQYTLSFEKGRAVYDMPKSRYWANYTKGYQGQGGVNLAIFSIRKTDYTTYTLTISNSITYIFVIADKPKGGSYFSPREQVYAKYYAETGSEALISVPVSDDPAPTQYNLTFVKDGAVYDMPKSRHWARYTRDDQGQGGVNLAIFSIQKTDYTTYTLTFSNGIKYIFVIADIEDSRFNVRALAGAVVVAAVLIVMAIVAVVVGLIICIKKCIKRASRPGYKI